MTCLQLKTKWGSHSPSQSPFKISDTPGSIWHQHLNIIFFGRAHDTLRQQVWPFLCHCRINTKYKFTRPSETDRLYCGGRVDGQQITMHVFTIQNITNFSVIWYTFYHLFWIGHYQRVSHIPLQQNSKSQLIQTRLLIFWLSISGNSRLNLHC